MADVAPVADEAISEQKPEVEATTVKLEESTETPLQETEEEVADQQTVIPTEPVMPEVKAEAPVLPNEEQVSKKRLNGALEELEKKNADVRQMIQLQAELVSDNPDFIHKIAATNPELANQVVVKVWGQEGIKSYKQLTELSKLEEMKDSNPDLYEIKKELYQIKAEKAARKEVEKLATEKSVLAQKGILVNEYDPNYRKVKEALARVNPSLIESDYSAALEDAIAIAFRREPLAPVRATPTLPIGGGVVSAPIPSSRPQHGQNTTWLAQQLKENFGYKMENII